MITPIRDIILGFVKLKVPTLIGLVTSLTLGYVPVLTDETAKINEALQSRG